MKTIAIASVLWLAGCSCHSPRHTLPLAAHVGERVVLEGIAEPRKLGAAVRGDGFDVWVEQLHDWPVEFVGKRVRIAGILEERHDLPVVVQRPGEPIVAGIPVAEGQDLHAASLRYVIRAARWSLVR